MAAVEVAAVGGGRGVVGGRGGMRQSMCRNDVAFVLEAVKQEVRVDGRSPFDMRRLSIAFGIEDGTAEVQLGETRVLACVTAQLAQPYPDRPNEGSLSVFVEFSPMADAEYAAAAFGGAGGGGGGAAALQRGPIGEEAVELGRIVDRGLRESRAVDVESLCVVAGRFVWALRLDIRILDNGGNLVDAANMAALAALMSFRRPEVSSSTSSATATAAATWNEREQQQHQQQGGGRGRRGVEGPVDIVVHSAQERDPQPLTLHLLPITLTFAFFNDGQDVVLDPSLKEEAAMGSRLTVAVNAASADVCSLQKPGGLPVPSSQLLRCIRVAAVKAAELEKQLRDAVAAHDALRVQKKVRRKKGVAAQWEEARQGATVVPGGGGGRKGGEVVGQGGEELSEGQVMAARTAAMVLDDSALSQFSVGRKEGKGVGTSGAIEDGEMEDAEEEDGEEEEESEDEEDEGTGERGQEASLGQGGEEERHGASSSSKPAATELFMGAVSSWLDDGSDDRRTSRHDTSVGGVSPMEARFDEVAQLISNGSSVGQPKASGAVKSSKGAKTGASGGSSPTIRGSAPLTLADAVKRKKTKGRQ